MQMELIWKLLGCVICFGHTIFDIEYDIFSVFICFLKTWHLKMDYLFLPRTLFMGDNCMARCSTDLCHTKSSLGVTEHQAKIVCIVWCCCSWAKIYFMPLKGLTSHSYGFGETFTEMLWDRKLWHKLDVCPVQNKTGCPPCPGGSLDKFSIPTGSHDKLSFLKVMQYRRNNSKATWSSCNLEGISETCGDTSCIFTIMGDWHHWLGHLGHHCHESLQYVFSHVEFFTKVPQFVNKKS